MNLFVRFSTEGMDFPAFMTAFGSIVVLRAPSTKTLTENELEAVPAWLRRLARLNSERLQRAGGWAMICGGIFIAMLRIAHGR